MVNNFNIITKVILFNKKRNCKITYKELIILIILIIISNKTSNRYTRRMIKMMNNWMYKKQLKMKNPKMK